MREEFLFMSLPMFAKKLGKLADWVEKDLFRFGSASRPVMFHNNPVDRWASSSLP